MNKKINILKESIKHWKNIKGWLCEHPCNLEFDVDYAQSSCRTAIGETWIAKHCSLCNEYDVRGKCSAECPLIMYDNGGCKKTDSIYRKFIESKTFYEAYGNAKNMIDKLEECLILEDDTKNKKLYLTNEKEGSICEVEKLDNKEYSLTKDVYMKVTPRLNPEKFIPCKDEEYWTIDNYGTIVQLSNRSKETTDYHILTGNCFRDKLHAKTYLKVGTAMLKLAKEYPVDWGDSNQTKHIIIWEFDSDELYIDAWYTKKHPHEMCYSCDEPYEKLYEKGITKEELEWYVKREW